MYACVIYVFYILTACYMYQLYIQSVYVLYIILEQRLGQNEHKLLLKKASWGEWHWKAGRFTVGD